MAEKYQQTNQNKERSSLSRAGKGLVNVLDMIFVPTSFMRFARKERRPINENKHTKNLFYTGIAIAELARLCVYFGIGAKQYLNNP